MSPETVKPSNGAQCVGEGENGPRAPHEHRAPIIWEVTKAVVAFLVTAVVLTVSARLALVEGDQGAYTILSNVFFLVLGTYFHPVEMKPSSRRKP